MTTARVPSQYSELCHLPSELAGKAELANPDAGSRIAMRIREFKADVVNAKQRLAEHVRNNAKYLVPEEEQSAVAARARALLDRYAVVDTLALYYRNRTRYAFISLLAITFFAMLVFEVFARIFPEVFPPGVRPRLIVWLYPVLWLSAWSLWYYAHTRQYQKKYHDYRALAESLRVQFFWNLLGLEDRVEEHYLRKQQGELEWIRHAIACWRECDEKAIPASDLTAEQLTALKDLVRRCWVQGQLEYFTSAGPREDCRGKRCKRWGAALFWTSLGLAVILGVYEVWHQGKPSPEVHLIFLHEESVLRNRAKIVCPKAALIMLLG